MVASCIRRIARTGTVIVEQVGMRLRLSDFVRNTRGGATSIVATLVAVMVVAAAALIVDHNWLFGQRDTIKSASDSAAVAATIEMRRPGILDQFKTDGELKDHLKKVAKNYMLLNLTHLSAEDFQEAKDSLKVKVEPNRDAKAVSVSASADLGGTLFSRELPILDNYKGPEQIGVKAAVEGVSNPIEVVLAIDVSGSMGRRLDGQVAKGDGSDSRMAIVKRAAQALVDIVGPDKDRRIAVGLVPWHAQVQLNAKMQQDWETSGWAKYPEKRHFGAPYKCKRAVNCTSLAEDQDLPPSPPETWLGCLDEQRVDGTGHAKLPNEAALLDLPSEQNAFAQGIFPAYYGWAYDCFERSVTDKLGKDEFGLQLCYGTKSADADQWVFDNRAAQTFCVDNDIPPSILPLTTNKEKVKKQIYNLKRIDGGQTYSALGILWGTRLLTPNWKSVLGGAAAVHPVDPTSENGKGVRKAIVLLTDGEDNQCGKWDRSCALNQSQGISRETVCSLAKGDKEEGKIEIFVIAAMDPQQVSEGLADSLRDCSSQKDNPTGKYVFINNTSKEDLEDAFADIANQLTIFRRVQ